MSTKLTQTASFRSCGGGGRNSRLGLQRVVNVPSMTFSLLAPNTIIERDAPDYNDSEHDGSKREPSYIEKILALTQDDDSQADGEVSKIMERGENKEQQIVHDKNEDQINIDAGNKNGVNQNVDHSLLMQSQFPWKQEKDHGTYELVHFDRPAPPERIAAILDSVLEENRPENLFKSSKTNLRKKSTNITNNNNIKQSKYLNSPLSQRSLSLVSVSSLPRITCKPDHAHPSKETLHNNDKTCSLLMKLQNDQNRKRYSHPTTMSARISPTPPHGIRTPLSRPTSYSSSVGGVVGGFHNKGNERDIWCEAYALKHLAIDAKKKAKKIKKKKKEEHFTPGLIERTIKNIFEEHLAEPSYESHRLKAMAPLLSDLIKTRIKNLYPPRYRLICTVSIMEAKQQSSRMASLCCWDKEMDTFAEYVYEQSSYSVTCVVYGVYKE